jgi:poly(3-hydroxybutyrate) depolymerase
VLIHARFVLLLLLLCIFVPAQEMTPAAASNGPALQKGRIVPAVRSAAKPEQSYALYVPTNYDPQRNWPIIYVFDPSARGSVPLELMKEAAESYGYLLAGSNNSHNGSWNVARDAAQEMWSDTHRFLSIDDRRVYFAGLSGGARVSAQLAQSCNCAHGVFLNSAGFLASSPSTRLPKPAFAVFLMAGMTDFNYGELAELDAQLESLGVRHFLQRFDGGHAWAPATVWQEALAWSAMLEMQDNLRDRDPGVISTEFARATSRLRQREDAGDLYFAMGEYRGVAAAFDGLADTSALKQQLSVLVASPAVQEGAKGNLCAGA